MHVDAGPPTWPRRTSPRSSTSSPTGSARHLAPPGGVDAIHANYWLSGLAGHRLKHELDLPLVSTFHTLARVKAETGDPEPERRVDAETEVIGCSDAILRQLRRRGRPARRALRRRPVAHRDRAARRRPRLLLAGRPARRPPARSASATTRCCCSSAASSRSRASTSPSARWPSCRPPPRRRAGRRRRTERRRRRRARWPRPRRWSTIPASPTGCASSTPQPHHLLSTYYRAADVCSCRAARSRSASSPSRPRPAARRWWPPRSAGCARWSSTASPASSSTRRDPADYAAARRRRSSTTRACRPRSPRPRPSGPGATPGRPPRPGCAASTPTSRRARPCRCS